MKKFFNTLVVAGFLSSPLLAISIDENAKVIVTGYKTASKLAVPMSFDDVSFSFKNTSGNITEILNGASAIVNLNTVNTDRNPLRDKNLRDKLFAHINGNFAKANVNSVVGDENKGVLKTTIVFNDTAKDVDMAYQVTDEKIIAKGTINLQTDFNAKNAYDSFRNDKIIQGLHAKQTWAEVEIGFEIDIKNQ